MLKWVDEGQVYQLGGNQGEECDFYWCMDVLLGIEVWCQNFDQDDVEQVDGVGDQCVLGYCCVYCGEFVVLEQ